MVPVVRTETRSIQTALALAAEGMGLAVYPEMYFNSPYLFAGSRDMTVRERLEIFPFTREGAEDTIAIGYSRNRYLSQMSRDFIAMSLEAFGKDPGPFLEKLGSAD
jgi:DNA-binding transcriptional LysR family regulator